MNNEHITTSQHYELRLASHSSINEACEQLKAGQNIDKLVIIDDNYDDVRFWLKPLLAVLPESNIRVLELSGEVMFIGDEAYGETFDNNVLSFLRTLSCMQLSRLKVDECQLGSFGPELVQSLVDQPLEELVIPRNFLEDNFLQELAASLHKIPLRKLAIDFNCFSDTAFSEFISMLPTCSITQLSYWGHEGESSWQALCQVLPKSGLTHVHPAMNHVDDKQFLSLINNLPNTKLTYCNFMLDKVTDTAMIALCERLAQTEMKYLASNHRFESRSSWEKFIHKLPDTSLTHFDYAIDSLQADYCQPLLDILPHTRITALNLTTHKELPAIISHNLVKLVTQKQITELTLGKFARIKRWQRTFSRWFKLKIPEDSLMSFINCLPDTALRMLSFGDNVLDQNAINCLMACLIQTEITYLNIKVEDEVDISAILGALGDTKLDKLNFIGSLEQEHLLDEYSQSSDLHIQLGGVNKTKWFSFPPEQYFLSESYHRFIDAL